MVFKAIKSHSQGTPVYNNNERNTIITYLKNDQKVTLDRVLDDSSKADCSESNSLYRIKGTNNFVALDKADIKEQLLPYSDKTTVLMINNSYLYMQDGHKFINQRPLPNTNDSEKNKADLHTQHVTICTVTKAAALWISEERRANFLTSWKMAKCFQEKRCLYLLKRPMPNIFMGPN